MEDHRAVTADGTATIVDRPAEDVLVAWEVKHGSRPAWASAWLEISPTRLFSYSAERAD